MNYMVPFLALKNEVKVVSVKGQLKVDLTYDGFLDVVRQILQAVPVDENWYRESYPDVAEAIEQGSYRDAKHHFVTHGYVEGRRPFPVAVDEEWYLENNPDVKQGIEDGRFESAQAHFVQHGYEEGRKPSFLSL
jgi:hypothetical protein